MDQKIVFVTGSASGIGLQIGKTFLENGDFVVFSDINADKLEKVVGELKNSGYDCAGQACDVSSEDDIIKAIKKIAENYGRLDVLINNAGLQHVASIEDFPTEKFEQMIKIMLAGAFKTTKHAFPIMKKQGFGRIINISSINGLLALLERLLIIVPNTASLA